jgi:hypothetical protein
VRSGCLMKLLLPAIIDEGCTGGGGGGDGERRGAAEEAGRRRVWTGCRSELGWSGGNTSLEWTGGFCGRRRSAGSGGRGTRGRWLVAVGPLLEMWPVSRQWRRRVSFLHWLTWCWWSKQRKHRPRSSSLKTADAREQLDGGWHALTPASEVGEVEERFACLQSTSCQPCESCESAAWRADSGTNTMLRTEGPGGGAVGAWACEAGADRAEALDGGVGWQAAKLA